MTTLSISQQGQITLPADAVQSDVPVPAPVNVDNSPKELAEGEQRYRAFHEQMLKDHPPKGDVEHLEQLVSMIQTYCIDEMPANEQGQITFQRAVFESIQECLQVTIKKMKIMSTLKNPETLKLGELADAMVRLENNDFPYLARGSQGRVWIHHQKSADYRFVYEEFKKLINCLS